MSGLKSLLGCALLGAFLLCPRFLNPTLAQGAPDVAASDVLTYSQYLRGSWDSLIVTGNQYLNRGVDYYYLRLRMGIAYAQKKNYAMAVRQYNKALEFVPSDPVAMEYLYFAHLNKGDDFEARIWGSRLSEVRKKELGIIPHFINGYSADITYNFASSKDIPSVSGSEAVGTQQISDYFVNANITVKQFLADRFKVVHGFTYLSKSNQYYIKDLGTESTFSDKVIQKQYFLSGIAYPIRGLQLAVSYQQLWISSPLSVTGTGQAAPSTSSVSSSDYSFSLSALKSLGYFDVGYTYTGSALNDYKQRQHTMQLGIYPLGNLNLYLLNKVVLFHENSVPENKKTIVGETIGFKVTDHFWAEAAVLAGTIQNMSDFGSYIIYNDVSAIKWKSGINLLFPLNSGLILSLRAHYSAVDSDFSDVDISNTISYSTISITGGLSWKF